MCDLTFSISLQRQAERARASSGTVNKVMYCCGVWAECGDPWGNPIPPKGDQLSPSLWQSLFAPHTPQFCKASESQALGCALDGDKEMSLLKAWTKGQQTLPVPSSRACSDFLLKAAGNRAEALQEPVPTDGDPTERELCAPACSAPQALTHKAEVRREPHAL